MEIHILENCGIHEFHDLQFGFIPNRGTSMAVTLTHDVMEHFISRGTPVYVCSLDAEGAFDSLPHADVAGSAFQVYSMCLYIV